MKYLLILAMAMALAACSPDQGDATTETASEAMSEAVHGESHDENYGEEHHDNMHGTAEHAAIYAEHHADEIAAAIANPDRPAGDVGQDATRFPAEILAFSQIEPGSTVWDMGAGAGYFTRLISGLVGPEGHVTGQNPVKWRDRFGADWPEVHGQMMEDRANVNFVIVEFEDLGLEPGSLDAVTMANIYHDTIFYDFDRVDMNRGIFDALRSGGLLLVTDHAGVVGATARETRGLHRIDAELARSEIEAAGFVLVAESDVLRNPEDPRDTSVFGEEIRGHTDRFTMLFRKP